MTTTVPYWTTARDKYGRTAHHYHPNHVVTAGVVVKLPRSYTAEHPDRSYLANDWRVADRDSAVTYHTTLAAAKASLTGVPTEPQEQP
jgi:hypothetical protein